MRSNLAIAILCLLLGAALADWFSVQDATSGPSSRSPISFDIIPSAHAQAVAPSGGSISTSTGGTATTTTQIAADFELTPTQDDYGGMTLMPKSLDLSVYGEKLGYVMTIPQGGFVRWLTTTTSGRMFVSDADEFYLPSLNTVLYTASSYWFQLTDLALGTCNAAASGRIQTAAGSGGPSYCNATAWQRIPVGINASAAINFGSISAQTCADDTSLTATGATTGTPVACSTSASLESGIAGPFCRVSASNTIEVRLCNITGSPIDPASVTFYVQGLK